jgi:hypothetical protein
MPLPANPKSVAKPLLQSQAEEQRRLVPKISSLFDACEHPPPSRADCCIRDGAATSLVAA